MEAEAEAATIDAATPEAILEAVRPLLVDYPKLGVNRLLAKLREQQPDLGAATKEVRRALAELQALLLTTHCLLPTTHLRLTT